MSDLLLDELPTRWHGHEIIPDFRPMVWLVNTYVRGQTGDDPIGFAVSALWRFYKDPHCFLNDPQKIIDAYGYMIEFYKAGEKAAESAAAESSTAPSSGLAFDYQCDAGYIVAAFQQAYGIDLTREKVHWFRFRALFAALPEDTLMAKIMSWRTMDLSEYEGSMRAHYADLQERFALPAELRGVQPVSCPSKSMTLRSLRGFGTSRAPVPCPYCGRALPVWAEPHATAAGVWVKCKNPACKREVEIKL
ncbi:MAG: Gp15 family bacteriophage protein [Faecalibacterium sp.]